MMDSFHYFVFDGNPNNDGKGTALKNGNWLHKPYIAINQQHIGKDLDGTCCCQIITCFLPILKMYSVRAVQLVLVVCSPINMTQSSNSTMLLAKPVIKSTKLYIVVEIGIAANVANLSADRLGLTNIRFSILSMAYNLSTVRLRYIAVYFLSITLERHP